jgi:hypothetical protein
LCVCVGGGKLGGSAPADGLLRAGGTCIFSKISLNLGAGVNLHGSAQVDGGYAQGEPGGPRGHLEVTARGWFHSILKGGGCKLHVNMFTMSTVHCPLGTAFCHLHTLCPGWPVLPQSPTQAAGLPAGW